MISIRVKTPLLEVAVASDKAEDNLCEVVKAAIEVGQSAPVQNSLQAPIILKSLPAAIAAKESATAEKQLPLFSEDGKQGYSVISDTGSESKKQNKKLANGKGERTIAYNKINELISKGFFGEGGKGFGDIQRALSAIGYTISDGKLADALLRLVREGHLAREGERGSYVYKIPPSNASSSPS